jgi:hypothetical protein
MNGNLVATRLGAVALLVVLIAMATIPQPAHALTSGNRGYAKTTAAKIRTALKYIHDVYLQGEGGTTTKKTMITEFGWSTKNVTEKTQSSNLQTAYTEYKQTSYLQNAFWFFLRDEPGSGLYFGLLRPDSLQKPSWNTYQRYASY